MALGRLVFQWGGESAVKLQTTYLDGRVRIGVGNRGSLFVFTKGGEADSAAAKEWEVMFGEGASGRRLLPVFALPAVLGGMGACAWLFPPEVLAVSAVVLVVIALFLRVPRAGRRKVSTN